jgi:hypothetical protein
MKSSNLETLHFVHDLVASISNKELSKMFEKAFGLGKAKKMFYGTKKNQEPDDTGYAFMFNVETDKLFILDYATSQNSWAETAASQNPWILIGYISAHAVVCDMAKDFLAERIRVKIQNLEMYL